MATTTVTTAPAVDLRELRKARGFSQQKVAELAGCSISMVAQLERGYRPAGMSNVLPAVLALLGPDAQTE